VKSVKKYATFGFSYKPGVSSNLAKDHSNGNTCAAPSIVRIERKNCLTAQRRDQHPSLQGTCHSAAVC
jgi:hypothetical protein